MEVLVYRDQTGELHFVLDEEAAQAVWAFIGKTPLMMIVQGQPDHWPGHEGKE